MMFTRIAVGLALTGMVWASAYAATETVLKPEDFTANIPARMSVQGDTVTLSGEVLLRSKKVFENKTGKKYGIKGSFKALPNTPDNVVYLGFEPLDKNGKTIESVHARYIGGSCTKLVQDVKASDTVLKVEDASKWQPKGSRSVAMKAAKDLSDLPNRNILKGEVVKVEKKDGFWEITMSKPCGVTAKAGEFIREHQRGGYIYTIFGRTQRGIVNPEHNTVINYAGATGFRVVILCNWNRPKNGEVSKMEVKNVRLIEK